MRKGGGEAGEGYAEAETEEEEKDEVDNDGEAAERWKGTDLTSQMQEGAGGAFWVPGEQKNVGKIWGDRKRGKPS